MLIRKLKRFLELPAYEKVFFVEAYITLGVMRAAILRIPFKRMSQSLQQGTNKEKVISVTDSQLHTATSIGRIIGQAARHTPWESTCLAQSFTAQRMLKRRRIPGLFFLGATKDETSKEKMKAHSWSRCGTSIITGEKGHEQFAILSVYEWSAK